MKYLASAHPPLLFRFWEIFGKHFSQAFLGRAILRSFGFITLPFLTYYLLPAQMGAYNLLFSYYGVVTEVCTLGLRQLYLIDYFKVSHQGRQALLAGKIIVLFAGLAAPLFALSCVGIIPLLGSEFAALAFILAASSYARIYTEMYLNTLRMQMHFFPYNVFCIGFALLQLVFVVTSVVVCGMGLYGLAGSVLLSEALQLILVVCLTGKDLVKMLKLSVSKNELASRPLLALLRSSWLFVPSVLSFWVLTNIDQWMVEAMVGLSAAGLYSFALKFPLLIDYLVSSTIILVYTPIHHSGMRNDALSQITKTRIFSVAALFLGAFFILLLNPFIPIIGVLIDKQYFPALPYIAPLFFAALLRLAMNILHLTLQYQGKVAIIVSINFLGAVLNSLLNRQMIPIYGVWGAVAATIISFSAMYFCSLAVHTFSSNKRGLS